MSRIGIGKPTVVQVQDPQCSQCTALQRQARRTLRCFKTQDVQYLVARVRTEEGRQFATHHSMRHVTLTLFDADGTLDQVLKGARPRDQLKPCFTDLVGQA